MKNMWLIGLVVFLTACGSAMFSQNAVQSPPIDLNEPVIVYGKSGGFAGLVQEWNIYADGRIENSKGELVGQAEPEEVTAVLQTADEVEFYKLDGEYFDGDECCDLISYTLTITDGEQTKTVITRDNSPHPPAFEIVLTAVEDLIYDNAITE